MYSTSRYERTSDIDHTDISKAARPARRQRHGTRRGALVGSDPTRPQCMSTDRERVSSAQTSVSTRNNVSVFTQARIYGSTTISDDGTMQWCARAPHSCNTQAQGMLGTPSHMDRLLHQQGSLCCPYTRYLIINSMTAFMGGRPPCLSQTPLRSSAKSLALIKSLAQTM